jgi:hypothetical protein
MARKAKSERRPICRTERFLFLLKKAMEAWDECRPAPTRPDGRAGMKRYLQEAERHRFEREEFETAARKRLALAAQFYEDKIDDAIYEANL